MKKTVRNLIGTLLIAAAIAVTQIPASDAEAVDTSSASDFQMDGTTLVKYNGTAEDVSVSDYVERIEAEAFAGNDSVRHVTVGDSVEVIGASAFAQCRNLESVTIPDSVVQIDNAAFSGCPALAEVSIGSGLSSLGNGVFAGDYSLEDVWISSSNPKFTGDDGAIYNKNGWDTLYQVLAGRRGDSYVTPSTVSKIKPYAFWGNYNLESVEIGSNVKEIPAYAFSNCKNLKDVYIPYSVKNIDMKAFEDCVRLREIEIPLSVASIHSTAFDGCTKLTIEAEPGTVAYEYAQTLALEDIDVSEYEEAPVPSSAESVSENDAGDGETPQITAPMDYYHEVSHINAMEEEEDDNVRGKSRVIGSEVVVLIDNAQAAVNVGSTGEVLGGVPVSEEEELTDTVPGLAGSDDAKGGSFPKYTVVGGTVIAAQAYYDDDRTSYEIPEGIVRLGEFAFARSGLTSIRIPDGVEEIGYAAFYHCDDLADVTIPGSVREIAPAAFLKTPWLDGWKQNVGGDPFLIVGDGILLAYKGNDSVVSVPDTVKQIGAEAFRGSEGIEKVVLPDSVKVIGEGAFEDCGSLKEIEGGEQVQEIRDRAFAGCPIATVHVPASVEKIGLRAFDSTDAAKTAGSGVVVFGGEKLPEVSHEETATKLYRDAYRGMALAGSDIAVVPAGVTDLSGTILEDGRTGFAGVICKIAKEAADGEDGILQIVGRQGRTNFRRAGDSCAIDGKVYVLEDGAEKLADIAAAQEDTPGISVRINSYSLPQSGAAGAVMEGAEGGYTLSIQDSEEAKAEIGAVYKELYGNKLPHNLCAYEMTLTETRTGLPITSLGRQRMEVTLPLPKGVGTEGLHVVCLDGDGQLEEVESRIVSSDGADAVAFTAKHFSCYGVYNYGDSSLRVADVQDGQAVFTSLGSKDDSPNTGDHSIHPKWFLCVGLLSSAMAVFFYRGRGRSGGDGTRIRPSK